MTIILLKGLEETQGGDGCVCGLQGGDAFMCEGFLHGFYYSWCFVVFIFESLL